MGTTRAATTHDKQGSPTSTREAPQGRTYGRRQLDNVPESTPPLDRYLGNSYVQSLAVRESRLQQESSLPPIVSEVLHSSGQPLDPNTRTFMESRFDADFSQVRVHSDGQAVASARALQSSAYTVGRDIIFGAGQFAPHAAQGRRLLAHELTHVVQQGQSASTPHHLISSPADTAEVEAGRIAKRILTPSPNLIAVKVSAQRTATVQRQASPDEFTFLRKPSLPSITARVSSGEDKDEYLKQQISLSLKQGHFDLKARAQRSVSAGGDLRQLWRTINSSHEFDSLLNRLIYTRYFLKYFTQAWEDRELSDDETAAWLFQIEKAYQRHAEEEALKPVDEAILRENERARQEYQENVIKQEIAKLQKQEAIRKFPGHIDPRKYPGVIPHGLALLTNPTVMAVVNMSIYFVPVVGQARGIVEAIVGYNLLTREKLGLLDRLLGALPLAPLALKGGKIVIRGASLVVNTATEKAALILAISKRVRKEPAEILALLSRLEKPAARIDTIREARAAIAAGRNLSAAELKVLKEVDEALQGGKAIPKASAGSTAPLAPVGPAGAAKEFPIPPKPAAPAPTPAPPPQPAPPRGQLAKDPGSAPPEPVIATNKGRSPTIRPGGSQAKYRRPPPGGYRVPPRRGELRTDLPKGARRGDRRGATPTGPPRRRRGGGGEGETPPDFDDIPTSIRQRPGEKPQTPQETVQGKIGKHKQGGQCHHRGQRHHRPPRCIPVSSPERCQCHHRPPRCIPVSSPERCQCHHGSQGNHRQCHHGSQRNHRQCHHGSQRNHRQCHHGSQRQHRPPYQNRVQHCKGNQTGTNFLYPKVTEDLMVQ